MTRKEKQDVYVLTRVEQGWQAHQQVVSYHKKGNDWFFYDLTKAEIAAKKYIAENPLAEVYIFKSIARAKTSIGPIVIESI